MDHHQNEYHRNQWHLEGLQLVARNEDEPKLLHAPHKSEERLRTNWQFQNLIGIPGVEIQGEKVFIQNAQSQTKW